MSSVAREVKKMSCPPEIAAILLEIVKTGLLRIRQLGWNHDPDRCAIEAEHVHNLPDLVKVYSPDLLQFYWETERISFIDQSTPAERANFEPLWDQLRPHVERSTDGLLTQ